MGQLLLDQFTTNESPVTSPRTCEPGPGTLTLTNTVTGATISIASSELHMTRPTGGQDAEQYKIVTAARTKSCGLTFSHRYKPYITQNTQLQGGAMYHPATTQLRCRVAGNIVATDFSLTSNTWYDIATLFHGFGALNFIKGGSEFPDWTLLLPSHGEYDLTKTWFLKNFNSELYVDNLSLYLREDEMSSEGRWLTDYVHYVLSTTLSVVLNHTADGIISFNWAPNTNGQVTCRFRRIDDDNCYYLICKQSDSTIKLYRREGGSWTELDAGKTQTWGTTSQYKVMIRFSGGSISTMVDTTQKHSVSGETFNLTQTNATFTPSLTEGLSDIMSYPLVWSGSSASVLEPPSYRTNSLRSNLVAGVFDIHTSVTTGGVMWFEGDRTTALASYLNFLNPHFIFFGGDQGDTFGDGDDYLLFKNAMIDKLGSQEVRMMRGNHDEDTDYDSGSNNQFTTFNSTFPTETWPDHWVYDWSDPQIRFIAAHTYIQHGGAESSFFNIDSSESDWIASQIDSLPGSGWKAIIITHAPYATDFGNYIHPNLGRNYLDSVITEARQGKILQWWNGHRHATSLATSTYNGVECLNVPASGENGGGMLLAEYDSSETKLYLKVRRTRDLFAVNNQGSYPMDTLDPTPLNSTVMAKQLRMELGLGL